MLLVGRAGATQSPRAVWDNMPDWWANAAPSIRWNLYSGCPFGAPKQQYPGYSTVAVERWPRAVASI